MGTKWFISDTHLGHYNILKFIVEGGERLRPEFDSLEEMHECIFQNWAERVKPGDTVYHLGDVALGKLGRSVMKRINTLPGNKRLIRGNHDLYNDREYYDAGFQKIYGVRQLNGVWLTHVPMHTQSAYAERCIGNIHGHLHSYVILKKSPYSNTTIQDLKYFNASVERIGYKPIALETIATTHNWELR